MNIDEITLSLADKIGIVAEDCEIIEFAHALLAELAKQEPVASAIFFCGEPCEVYLDRDAAQLEFDIRNNTHPDKSRKLVNLYAAHIPPAVPEGWISVAERLPEIDYSKPAYDRKVRVLCAWGNHVAEMAYVSNGYAKTEKGALPRFEWMGKISPFPVDHWMPLPAAPTPKEKS